MHDVNNYYNSNNIIYYYSRDFFYSYKLQCESYQLATCVD